MHQVLRLAMAGLWLLAVGYCLPARAQAPWAVAPLAPASRPAWPADASSTPDATSTSAAYDAPMAGVAATPLGMDETIARALRGNLDLVAVRREVEAAAALRDQAARRLNPSVSYDVEQVRSGMRADSVAVSVPVELGGKRAARITVADRASGAANAEVALRAAELRAAAIQFFADALAAQEREQFARDSVALARRALDVATRRVLAGRVSPVEQTRAQVAEAGARIEASQAAAELAAARQRLAALLGEPTPTFGALAGSLDALPELPSEAQLDARLAQAPALARARAEIAQREALAALARTQRIPTVAVTAGTRTLAETGQRAASLGLALAVPIFDANQGNIREAQVRTEQARQQLEAAALRLRAEALAAWERLAAARREAALVRSEALPGAASALEAATRGFELGKFSFLDVLDAQRTLFAIRSQRLRAGADAWRASAELERLLGVADADAPLR